MIMARGFRIVIASFALVVTGFVSGCADDYGEACDMPNTVEFEVACASSEDGTNAGTCVFRNSADCSTRICARYQGSSDFCTQECQLDDPSSCPSDSVCYAPANRESQAICVPNSVYLSGDAE